MKIADEPYKTYVPFHDGFIEIWETKPKQCWAHVKQHLEVCMFLGADVFFIDLKIPLNFCGGRDGSRTLPC